MYPGPPKMRALKDCSYTAFISYAHADDAAWYGWVRQFRDELERSLDALLRGVALPRSHLSAENGPVSGTLSEQLKQRVAQSFALVIVVHDNYAQSAWCLRELEYFQELWGEQGFRERLYIVALSESAMVSVAGGSDWQRLLPHQDQLWLPFFDAADRTRPVDVYMAPGLVSTAFRTPFERLRSDLASKLKAAAAAGRSERAAVPIAPMAPSATAAGPVAEPSARMDPGLGRVAWAFGPKASHARWQQALHGLQAVGADVQVLSQDLVYGDFEELVSCQHLVLPFDDHEPLMPIVGAGGHLQLLRDAWIKKGRSPANVHWLDLRAEPAPTTPFDAPAPTAPSAAVYVASLGVSTVTLPKLLSRWSVAGPEAETGSAPLRIYIESNRHERNHWLSLGQQIRREWQTLGPQLAPNQVPPLSLRARGLPVEHMDQFPNLDDADGVVLLWGRKSSEALVAQIDKVEAKLSHDQPLTPGIVAYLMPPQPASEPVPAWGWQVLRFQAPDEGAITVLPQEQGELKRFLSQAFERRRLREGKGA